MYEFDDHVLPFFLRVSKGSQVHFLWGGWVLEGVFRFPFLDLIED